MSPQSFGNLPLAAMNAPCVELHNGSSFSKIFDLEFNLSRISSSSIPTRVQSVPPCYGSEKGAASLISILNEAKELLAQCKEDEVPAYIFCSKYPRWIQERAQHNLTPPEQKRVTFHVKALGAWRGALADDDVLRAELKQIAEDAGVPPSRHDDLLKLIVQPAEVLTPEMAGLIEPLLVAVGVRSPEIRVVPSLSAVEPFPAGAYLKLKRLQDRVTFSASKTLEVKLFGKSISYPDFRIFDLYQLDKDGVEAFTSKAKLEPEETESLHRHLESASKWYRPLARVATSTRNPAHLLECLRNSGLASATPPLAEQMLRDPNSKEAIGAMMSFWELVSQNFRPNNSAHGGETFSKGPSISQIRKSKKGRGLPPSNQDIRLDNIFVFPSLKSSEPVVIDWDGGPQSTEAPINDFLKLLKSSQSLAEVVGTLQLSPECLLEYELVLLDAYQLNSLDELKAQLLRVPSSAPAVPTLRDLGFAIKNALQFDAENEGASSTEAIAKAFSLSEKDLSGYLRKLTEAQFFNE